METPALYPEQQISQGMGQTQLNCNEPIINIYMYV